VVSPVRFANCRTGTPVPGDVHGPGSPWRSSSAGLGFQRSFKKGLVGAVLLGLSFCLSRLWTY